MIRLLAVMYCCLLVSCASPRELAKKEAAVLTGDDKSTPVDNPQCKLFSATEAARYIGEPVAAGRNAALGCQWVAKSGSGDMIVAVVPATYHEPPKLAKGYRAVADVGAKGFVAPHLDGWVAGAILGQQAIRVSVAGKGASETTAIELLKETLKRHSG